MNSKKQRALILWLWSGAGLVFLMLIIGGITRLTGSGLSMSDWSLIIGTLPPMNESEWLAAFEQYKQFPQYQQVNAGMSLEAFKNIFFWEYLHRLSGRITGLVFLIPFLFFWLRGYLNRKLLKRLLFLFGLGALQGTMGWVMVKSGLVDLPYVSHYRLAVHLILAFILAGCCVWFALDIGKNTITSPLKNVGNLKKWTIVIGIVFFLQLIWGAFTAGLQAGGIYNTFPLMNGEWLPQNVWTLQPVILNLLENPGTVQWIHRIVGTVLAFMVLWLWMRTKNSNAAGRLKRNAHLLLGAVIVQYVLGVFTVIYQVPVILGVAHQAVAMLFWISWLMFYYILNNKKQKKYVYLR